MEYSIVVATYNSAKHINQFVLELLDIFQKKQSEFEIVLVNDSSSDSTQKILEDLSCKHSQIQILELTRNSGQQIAFSAGIDNANGRVVILLDDDMLNFEEAINSVIQPVILGEYDIAIGTSSPKGSIRRITSKFFWKIMSRISNQVIKNRELTLRCFSREVASNYKLYKERSRSITEIMLDLGYRRTYIELKNIGFRNIQSRHNFHKRFRLFLQILTTSRQNSGVGLMYFSFISLILLPITSLVLYLIGAITFENRVAFVLAGMIWFSFSSFVFLFGLVLFIIAILLRESQQRPLYHLKNKKS
jgi:glycosyltransferase involved in cell wall biosynthesis